MEPADQTALLAAARSPSPGSGLLLTSLLVCLSLLAPACLLLSGFQLVSKLVTKLGSFSVCYEKPNHTGHFMKLVRIQILAPERGHSCSSKPFAIWLAPPFPPGALCPSVHSVQCACVPVVWPPRPGQLSREPMSHCPLPCSGCFSLSLSKSGLPGMAELPRPSEFPLSSYTSVI